ncbi:polyprenol monophosphomannose synthase [Demequina sp. TTPB684]|uniref:polyprenol monophosphomannose synthase n=1 Tax=unclassified Demequina TaxID=2620311 RepID=UPI001CF3D4F4|nr:MULTISPECIES: polyprenol monophosphomannose synthase [unclassified Demequina]MCB2413116.1 polyprenol monophosphomannose synthase [Demequina sp. TTPB684]UPU89278.1 polyprenol monophosphomannose synthase [Demequina sp. TMPB413]
MTVLVIIPTYNEIESLPRQVDGVRAIAPDVDIMVVDDGSPDGTGEWADSRAASDDKVFALHRASKQGLGAAYLEAFAWALERDYDVVVEMDADGSHRPEDLPSILAKAASHDLVIGSRWVPGGSVVNWPAHRKFLSTNANRYVRLALGVPIKDATAGFRSYRTELLRRLELDRVESQGYCFQVDMAWRVVGAGGTVTEVPITFVERDAGASKMSGAIIREALIKVTWWGLQRLWGGRTRRHSRRD